MRRLTLRIREDQDELLRELKQRSIYEDDVPEIESKSAVIRDALDDLLNQYQETHNIEDIVDDETLLEFRHEQRKKETTPISRGAKFAERFSDHCDDLFTGRDGEKADIQTIETLSENYIEDVRDHHELGGLSETARDQQITSIRRRVEEYRADLEAARYSPDERDVPNDAEFGQNVLQLRDQIEDVVERIVEIAEGDAYDPDAIVDALSGEFAVSDEAIKYVLDLIVPDDQDVRRALKDGRDVEFREIMRDDALESADDEPALEGGVVDESPDHDHVPRTGAESERATIEIDSESEDVNGHSNGHSDEPIVVDGDRLRDVIDSEIQESETDPAEGST